MDLREIRFGGADPYRPTAGSCEHGTEPSCFIKGMEYD